MPEILATLRVQCNDVAVAITSKHQSRRGGQHTGRGNRRIAEFPFAIAGQRVDRTERTEVLLIAYTCRATGLVLLPLSERLVEREVDGAGLARGHEKETLRRIVRRRELVRPSTEIRAHLRAAFL